MAQRRNPSAANPEHGFSTGGSRVTSPPDAPRTTLRRDGERWKLVADLATAQARMRPEHPGPEPW
ncbi:hypothetical protein [Streptomyces sp. NPDC059787]|uniref:hypothetical protein n=1 Tax=Streptomyces sp. NPDC059787 TaxID=3346947 RepID=UPI00364FD42F